jgi:hypothetical protein
MDDFAKAQSRAYLLVSVGVWMMIPLLVETVASIVFRV